MSVLPRNVMGAFFRQLKTRYKRCLAPGLICRQDVISAHSIQNSRILDVLCKSGHVVMLQSRVDANAGMTVEWKPVGRNQATTFTGLCAEHDTKLFSTLLTRRLDPQCLVLNAFPVDADTHIIFSFKARQRSAILDHLHPLLIAHGPYQRYLLSRLILTQCENFVLSPEAYTSLTPDARDVIKNHFFQTIRDPEAGLDDPRLMLFGAT